MLLFGKDYLERENDRQELLPPPLADTETDADQSPDDERKKWYQKRREKKELENEKQ